MRDLTLMNSKQMKTLYLSAAALLLSLNLFAQGVKSEKFTPFYTKDEAPHMERVIPNPPELTDAQFFYDWTQYQWGKSIRETERGQLAVADAGIAAAAAKQPMNSRRFMCPHTFLKKTPCIICAFHSHVNYPDPKCQPPSAHNYHRVARNGNMNKSTKEQ